MTDTSRRYVHSLKLTEPQSLALVDLALDAGDGFDTGLIVGRWIDAHLEVDRARRGNINRDPEPEGPPLTDNLITKGAKVRLPEWAADEYITVTAVGQLYFLAEPSNLTHDLGEEAICRLLRDWEPWVGPPRDTSFLNLYASGGYGYRYPTRSDADDIANKVGVPREAVAVRSSDGTWRIEAV